MTLFSLLNQKKNAQMNSLNDTINSHLPNYVCPPPPLKKRKCLVSVCLGLRYNIIALAIELVYSV